MRMFLSPGCSPTVPYDIMYTDKVFVEALPINSVSETFSGSLKVECIVLHLLVEAIDYR